MFDSTIHIMLSIVTIILSVRLSNVERQMARHHSTICGDKTSFYRSWGH